MAKKESGNHSASANDFLAPAAPINVVATDVGTSRPYNDGAASVSFELPVNSPAATSYTVYESDGNGNIINSSNYATGTSSPIQIGSLSTPDSGTSQFVVVASNSSGGGLPSSPSSAISITGVPATPSAPTATSTTVNQDGLSWTAPNTGGKTITTYYWESDDSKSGNTTSTSATIAQEGGTSQSYRVRAENANGLGNWSAYSSSVVTTTPFFPPYFPFFPPFFPFFPPFFPFFPPFFPFFPPFFPYFPFFPFFPFFPPSFKTAPVVLSNDVNKLFILTEDFGYLEEKYLTDNDQLSSIKISELSGAIDLKNWSSDSLTVEGSTIYEIKRIVSISKESTFIEINKEVFNDKTWLLCRIDETYKFIKSTLVEVGFYIYNSDSKEFVSVESVEPLDSISDICYDIDIDGPYIIGTALGFISLIDME